MPIAKHQLGQTLAKTSKPT